MSDMADKQILKNQLILLLEAYYKAPSIRDKEIQEEIQSTREILKMYEGV